MSLILKWERAPSSDPLETLKLLSQHAVGFSTESPVLLSKNTSVGEHVRDLSLVRIFFWTE